jgi:MFS family permease
VSVLSRVTETLGPTYVATVLHADPARTVYVFAPAGAGALVALAVTPKVIDRLGERTAAAIAVLIMCVALFSLAFIDTLAPILAPISPLRIVRLTGLNPSDELLAASFVSLFTGFAVSMSSVSVQTYVNRRVPMLQQGRVFGLESMLASAAALGPMLLLGFIAEVTSIQAILFFAPWVVLVGTYVLLVLAGKWTGVEPMSRAQVVESFWNEPPHEAAAPAS